MKDPESEAVSISSLKELAQPDSEVNWVACVTKHSLFATPATLV